MDARLQRRVQRYGWDLASDAYETTWREQLAPAQRELMAQAALATGERVLDVACGTGLASFPALHAVGPSGEVVGVDIAGEMVGIAQRRAAARRLSNIRFARMDAEAMDFPGGTFDVVLCALGLMYMPEPERALREMRRVLRPGGRIVAAVWGDRRRCGWSGVFPIVDEQVASEVCPLFFGLGQEGALEKALRTAGFQPERSRRLFARLVYADGASACDAAFAGGPVALAWSRFSPEVRQQVVERYLQSIESWRIGSGYSLPGEFVVVSAFAV
ncbi:MAG: methyltransferase domain-containing protein [Burkholderiaceae bacterium]